MIRQVAFLIITSSMIIYGLLYTIKWVGWPSAIERKNKVLRAVRTGFSSTLLSISLLLMYLYWTSPETFWRQWTVSTIIGSMFFVVIPLFFIMIIASFIRFSSWERMESMMTNRLRKIVESKTKNDKN